MPDRRAATIQIFNPPCATVTLWQSCQHRDPDSHPDCRCFPIQIAALHAGYHPGDPRWAAAARSDARKAPRALTPAACLARSADRAGLWLSLVPAQRSTARSSFGERPDFMGTGVAFSPTPSAALRYWNMARQRYCRRLARSYNTLRVSADPVAKPAAHSRAESRGSRSSKAAPGEETDSPLEGAGFETSVPAIGMMVIVRAARPDAFGARPTVRIPLAPSRSGHICAAKDFTDRCRREPAKPRQDAPAAHPVASTMRSCSPSR
jgi:hypothetical protein